MSSWRISFEFLDPEWIAKIFPPVVEMLVVDSYFRWNVALNLGETKIGSIYRYLCKRLAETKGRELSAEEFLVARAYCALRWFPDRACSMQGYVGETQRENVFLISFLQQSALDEICEFSKEDEIPIVAGAEFERLSGLESSQFVGRALLKICTHGMPRDHAGNVWPPVGSGALDGTLLLLGIEKPYLWKRGKGPSLESREIAEMVRKFA